MPFWYGVGDAVVVQFVAYCFAVAVGLVMSGAIASLWQIATNERPGIDLLYQGGLAAPIQGLVFVLTLPIRLISNGVKLFAKRTYSALLAFLVAIGLSFIQGVVVLTKVFGAT